jgi:predicted NBD/HSP70 family sugar kinase
MLASLSDDITTLRAENISEIISLPDPMVTKLREEVARHFAIGLANIANIINPQVIVITGGVGLGFFQYTAFQNAVNRHIKTYVLEACRPIIVQSRIRREAQVIGAAMIGSNIIRL